MDPLRQLQMPQQHPWFTTHNSGQLEASNSAMFMDQATAPSYRNQQFVNTGAGHPIIEGGVSNGDDAPHGNMSTGPASLDNIWHVLCRIEKSLNGRLDDVNQQVMTNRSVIDKNSTDVSYLQNRVTQLEDENMMLQEIVRAKTVVIGGLTTTSSDPDHLETKVNEVLAEIGLVPTDIDIDCIFKLKGGANDKKPVLVKLLRQKDRKKILDAAEQKFGKGRSAKWIKPDQPKKVRDTRKKMSRFYEQAIQKKQDVKVIRDYMVVNGIRFNYNPVADCMVEIGPVHRPT